MVSVKKITEAQVVLEDGTIEDYKAYSKMYTKLTSVNGYAVIKDGKVVKAKNGQFEIYGKKSIASQVAANIK